MTKTYAKEFTAKMMAAKAAKKDGNKYVVVPVADGFTFTKVVALVSSSKTNVVGRASSGNWLKQVVTYLHNNSIDAETATSHTDDRGRIWIGDATHSNLFWLKSTERAAAVLAALAKGTTRASASVAA